MELKQLEYVLEVAKTGSIGSASQNLYLSQANLSYAIKSLESELGRKIFSRTNHGIELTEFGRQFIHYAGPFYGQYKFFENICKNTAKKKRTSFSVFASPIKFVNTVFIDLYQDNINDNLHLVYNEDTLDNILKAVESSYADIGVVTFSSLWKKTFLRLVSNMGLSYTKLSEEEPQVIVSNKNPLYHLNPEYVSYDDLLPYQYVSVYTGAFDNSVNDDFVNGKIKNNQGKSEMIVYNRACLYDILYRTDAYTVASNNKQAYKEAEAYENIKAIPLKSPGFMVEIGFIQKEFKVANRIELEFIDRLKAKIKG